MSDSSYKLVEVVWNDSISWGLWHSPSDVNDWLKKIDSGDPIKSVGYIFHDNKNRLVLVMQVGITGENVGEVVVIPRGCIVSVTTLVPEQHGPTIHYVEPLEPTIPRCGMLNPVNAYIRCSLPSGHDSRHSWQKTKTTEGVTVAALSGVRFCGNLPPDHNPFGDPLDESGCHMPPGHTGPHSWQCATMNPLNTASVLCFKKVGHAGPHLFTQTESIASSIPVHDT